MRSRHRIIMGLVIGVAGCAQILQADSPYYLGETGGDGGTQNNAGMGGTPGSGGTNTSSGGQGGEGGGAGVCTTVADCPKGDMDCIVPLCINKTCGTTNAPAGTLCRIDATDVCDGDGQCVQCLLPEHCTDIVEDECVKRSCVNQECKPVFAPNGQLASATLQKPGDCQKIVCDGSGKTQSVTDNADIPDDGNACTENICAAGLPKTTNLPQGTTCGINLVCNAAGQCLGCLTAADCPGTEDACKQRSCVGGVCGFQYVPANTPVGQMQQTAKDCKLAVCDGNGSILFNPDTTDLPVDGNSCTQDVCSADGTASNPPAPLNTACGVNNVDRCDGLGACKKANGKTCAAGSECATSYCIDGYCCDSTCTGTCKACNVSQKLGTCSSVPSGQDDPNGSTPCSSSTMSCNGQGSCKLDNAQPCSSDSNCVSDRCIDGVCCSSSCSSTCKACNVPGSAGTCANILFGADDANASTTCVGATVSCNGSGSCKKENGETCTTASECLNGLCTGTPSVCAGP